MRPPAVMMLVLWVVKFDVGCMSADEVGAVACVSGGSNCRKPVRCIDFP